MLKSVLIANRGEIARRVIRTCKRLGVRTVAVYSDSDAKALHVREADEAVHIGASPAKESYLRGENIIAAAKQTGAEAIHPGYGFLSENADFAQAVIDAGLIWIGPRPDSIRAMGLKDAAKKLMAEAGVPTTPGYLGEDQSEERLQKEADAIGYPVLIKAVAGGGGKGMRKVEKKADFKAALASAKREAASSFGDDRVLLEMYVQRPRHIEVQVFGDTHGNVVHLFERDCSLQRRHQKVIEEAPAPGMDEATRKAVTDAAVLAAKAVNYVGAGTIEFIADASEGLRGDRIWFMEMNTRLQVEHPVTEEITGQDLVEWQLCVASGEKLPLKQEGLKINGHAIEARLYAENVDAGFLPSTGRLEVLSLPQPFPNIVRVDSAVAEGDEVTPYYDPMIAKIIVHGRTRKEAIAAMSEEWDAVGAWPVKTNAGFLARCLADPGFASGDVNTGLIAARGEALSRQPSPSSGVLENAAKAINSNAIFVGSGGDRTVASSPWSQLAGFRLNSESVPIARMLFKGERVSVTLGAAPQAGWLAHGGSEVVIFDRGEAYEFTLDTGERSADEATAGDGAILSPMPGKIVSVAAKAGAKLKKGDPILVLEAMKMEHTLTAPFDGKLSELNAKAGAQVSEGVLLAKLEKD
ncbi:acetyl/propionyl/methylcrotonyl-CoA carboxylase subunit alpha [Candidatus Viadribacter manganicus]|uniref:Methylcrotonoyl-CoA carboxylase n=1 Tax=Candidatus Viadribacter manganicus TaxID=1759059 RepID=A0A1B1AJ51_9PROT|nr:acetyl/propionyl/methylcrotonyl-CoA carboxylase subunit alpha [Candidatus Viadribacter manganicus]ANP46575.1 methylcrotonoyl-CoA carboxylase [Candidatus Viadribacter manganicus]